MFDAVVKIFKAAAVGALNSSAKSLFLLAQMLHRVRVVLFPEHRSNRRAGASALNSTEALCVQ